MEDLEIIQCSDSIDYISRHLSTYPLVKLFVVLLDCVSSAKRMIPLIGTVDMRDGPFLRSVEIQNNFLQSFEGIVTTLVG